VLVQLRDKLVADAEGFNVHRRQHKTIQIGLDAKIRRHMLYAKETYAGHVGSDNHKPTSLRGIAKKATVVKQDWTCAKASTTEEPDEGKLHVRDCAGGAG